MIKSESVAQSSGKDLPAWRRFYDKTWVRNAVGLLVLAVIVGGLFAVDRITGESVGALDGGPPREGELAPQFALRNPEGELVELSDFRGRPVWINFWASWCGPCRRELPDIQKLANEFDDQGLVVLAVNQEESATKALDFWEELDLDLPIVLDSNGAVSDQYRLFGLPNNFFIDGSGTLQTFTLGFLTEEQMRESLEEIGVE